MFGTSALFMTFGFQNNESILKWVANGFFQLILVAAGFLCAATLIMSMEIENLALLFWPFAAYYALIEVCFILMCLKDNMQIMKDRPKAKQEFCQLVERNQVHFHRYIRLHVLWWEDLYGKKPLPNSIVSMQNSFEKLMKYYKEYSK